MGESEKHVSNVEKVELDIDGEIITIEFFDEDDENDEDEIEYTKIDDYNVSQQIKEDYRKAIFLYKHSKPEKIKRNDYCYWDYCYAKFDLGITEPKLYYRELLKEGYFEPSKLNDKLSTLKVVELKEILKKHNLTYSGKKDDLINKIIKEIPTAEINISKEEYYSLSEKGKDFINENINYIELYNHNSPYLDLEDYCNAISNDTYKRSFYDVALEIYNVKINKYIQKKDYIALKNCYHHVANIFKKQNRNKEALNFYLYHLIYDLSGIYYIVLLSAYEKGAQGNESYYGKYTKDYIMSRLNYCGVDKFLISDILNLKKEYNEEMLEKAYKSINLPYNVSSLEYLKSMLDEASNSTVFDYKKHKDLLAQRLNDLFLKLMEEIDIKYSKEEKNRKDTKLNNENV